LTLVQFQEATADDFLLEDKDEDYKDIQEKEEMDEGRDRVNTNLACASDAIDIAACMETQCQSYCTKTDVPLGQLFMYGFE
jgi:hypothetical protein